MLTLYAINNMFNLKYFVSAIFLYVVLCREPISIVLGVALNYAGVFI